MQDETASSLVTFSSVELSILSLILLWDVKADMVIVYRNLKNVRPYPEELEKPET